MHNATSEHRKQKRFWKRYALPPSLAYRLFERTGTSCGEHSAVPVNAYLGAKLDAICGNIKNEDDRREAMSLARMFLSARENAQRCAVDCAPYVHAKLQAVHHEHGPTGRYIIADKPMTEEEWIRERATVIDVKPEK